ncbi:glycosyltransferase family 2 protein [Azonexus sp.]|jgi:glycosyltransferase involved in cell wall biosynthesis|uniref:glycosyltransferase family 2 protein n=1 Tax=Azonexus sp. TaxID=1872668 RepID=UPI0027B8F720|nr:glycosyltransferase family 2 protein [Azonexus sp.]
MPSSDSCELTILMPCLNEAETLKICIDKARDSLDRLGIDGEVLIADNGSTDGSRAIAEAAGARVVPVAERGYGAALRGGIAAARGRYIIMGDADDSYAFDAIDTFHTRLKDGWELVMGNRFRGGIAPGAMPPLHRYLGNPVLSFIGRLFFRTPIRDFHCGLRGFQRDAIRKLGLQTDGMEFASEMIIKASLAKLRICEVPTTLQPDGRNRPPHLRSWRDGWRHLRFMLLFSPRWLFLYPGIVLFLIGLLGSAWVLPGLRVVTGIGFDIHSLLYFTASAIVGVQMTAFGVLARCTGACLGLLPHSRSTRWILEKFRLEVGLAVALLLIGISLSLIWKTFYGWESGGFPALDPSQTMRRAIPAAALGITGMELLAISFWITFLQFSPRPTK